MTSTRRRPRRLPRPLALAAAAILLAAPGTALAAPGGTPGPPSGHPRDAAITADQALLPDDGWASADGGTTGGAAASPEDVHDVSDRAELVEALAASEGVPSIIRVHGTIPVNADAEGEPISCEEIAEGTGYTLEGYLEAFDPETWGWEEEPAGPMEDARRAAATVQQQLITLTVPSDTTIIGAEEGAGLVGVSLSVRGVDNVIIRNLVLADTYDCFPAWDPTDGATGNWNSEYDSIRVVDGSTHIWIDHNAFTDEPMTDDQLPEHFGRTFQRHDGALDITNGSDLVTVSWNAFRDHDKLTLVGSTDRADRGDPGKLRVTFHHNLYEGVGQRAPRVRFGQVDVYNNHYVISRDQTVGYGYSIGVGFDSHLHVEANAFTTGGVVDAGQLLSVLKGSEVLTRDNLVDHRRVDLRAAYNEGRPAQEQLAEDTSWEPTLRRCVDRVQHVDGVVGAWAGPRFGPAPGRIGEDCRA